MSDRPEIVPVPDEPARPRLQPHVHTAGPEARCSCGVRVCLLCGEWSCSCLGEPCQRLTERELMNALQFAEILDGPREAYDIDGMLREAVPAWRRVSRELRIAWAERDQAARVIRGFEAARASDQEPYRDPEAGYRREELAGLVRELRAAGAVPQSEDAREVVQVGGRTRCRRCRVRAKKHNRKGCKEGFLP